MKSRSGYAFVGLFIGAVIDLLIDLLSAAIQQQPLGAQLTNPSSIVWLILFIVVGLLAGYWLGGTLEVPTSAVSPTTTPDQPKTMSMTRFRALLSYGKLRGKGIHLSDILLIASRIDIDSRD